MIIVKRPSGELVGETLVRVPDPELVKKYNQVVMELSILRQSSQNVKTKIKEVLVEKIVENPETQAKLQNALDQISALERARVDLQAKLRAKGMAIHQESKAPLTLIKTETKIIVSKAWIAMGVATGSALMFALMKLFHL